MKDIDLFVLIAFLVVTLFVMFYLVVFNYLKPNQTEWINGWPQNMHLAEQSIRRGGIVLSWAFGDKDFRVGVVAVLCIFRGVWAGKCSVCLVNYFVFAYPHIWNSHGRLCGRQIWPDMRKQWDCWVFITGMSCSWGWQEEEKSSQQSLKYWQWWSQAQVKGGVRLSSHRPLRRQSLPHSRHGNFLPAALEMLTSLSPRQGTRLTTEDIT